MISSIHSSLHIVFSH